MDGAPASVRSLFNDRLLSINSAFTLCAQQDAEPARPSKAAKYAGWEASLEVLLTALKTHAPVDGLLGACNHLCKA